MLKHKKIFILVIITLCLFALVISIAILKEKPISSTSLYQVKYEPSNEMTIKNILPVSDTLGKSFDGSGTKEGIQGYIEITIENRDTVEHTYSILVSKEDSNSLISGDYIKFYLTDIFDSPIKGFDSNSSPTYNTLLVSDLKPKSKFLSRVTLSSREKKVFKLKSWLADSYVISLNEEEFKCLIDVVEE